MTKNSRGKDFLLIGFMAFIILLLILSMYQRDRQWEKLADMERAMSEQSRDISSLRSALSRGSLNVRTTGTASDGTVSGVFRRAQTATQNADYAQGDWSVRALGSAIKSISPYVYSDREAQDIQQYVFETLVATDPDTLEPTGLIAKDWAISEDGLTFTFNMRDDVYFSDGEPLDSSDVVFTYNFVMNEKIQAPTHRAYYNRIETVEALGPYQVKVTFSEAYFKGLELAGGLYILPEHFYSQYLDKTNEFNESKGILLGSGPYQLPDPKGWKADTGSLELLRNPRYWGDVQPSYDRILWRVVQNASARLTTFRNGDVDSYSARPIEYEKLKNDRQILEKSEGFVYSSATDGYAFLGWNQEQDGKPSVFADKNVRLAMTYLVDRDRIIEDIYLGRAVPVASPFGPLSPQHDPNIEPRAHDPEKAKQLLKAAGFEDRDGNGVLEDNDGNPFEFKLTFFQDNEDTKRMVLLLKDLFAEAKVKLIPDPQEWPIMIEMLDKKNFDAITLGWGGTIESDLYQIFHSSQALTNGDNFIRYMNPELDKWIEAARAEPIAEKRMPLWHKAEAILYEDQPYTFLLRRQTMAFIDKRIKNLKVTKVGLNKGLIPTETYVPTTMQKYNN